MSTLTPFMNSAVSSLGNARRAGSRPLALRSFRCQCNRTVFFRNSECLACGTPLGYEPGTGLLLALAPGPEVNTWQPLGAEDGLLYRRCANFATPSGCNWLVPVDPAAAVMQTLCVACTLNRTIPDLSMPDNGLLWGRVESAKRRLISSLLALGLPVQSKLTDDPVYGVAFDFLHPTAEQPLVMTGHDDGVITINIEEADDAKRERIRAALHEPYRTLLGHFRHEIGHYYWDRLVRDSAWLEPYRALFGDERADYAAALQQHYQNGPPTDWRMRYVSGYASVHPWEDWAETWAHYLHMVDTVDTAHSFGLDSSDVDLAIEPFMPHALWQPEAVPGEGFLNFLNEWVGITAVMTELSRSMGQPDFYPFALPRPAVAKLHFIHLLIQDAGSAVVSGAPPLQNL